MGRADYLELTENHSQILMKRDIVSKLPNKQ
jgi:hypothetical protein